jgi:hypothetical protein
MATEAGMVQLTMENFDGMVFNSEDTWLVRCQCRWCRWWRRRRRRRRDEMFLYIARPPFCGQTSRGWAVVLMSI